MRILLRRKASLLGITCLGVLLTLLVTSARPHVYQSRASLEIQAFNENFLNLRDIYPAAAPSADAALYVQTQVELLQQDPLIEQVARKFHLEERPEFQPPDAFLNKLHQVIRVVPLRNSRIVQIVCDARDASLAAGLANTLARTFIDQSTETRQRAARQTYESLRLRLEEIRPRRVPQKTRTAQPDPNRGPLPAKADEDRLLYEAMLQKANDARMALNVRQSNIRLIGPAEPAARPYKPNLALNLVIGALGGLVLAIGCVMLQEQNMSVLHSPGEAEAYLALPELGAIPNHGARRSPALSFFDSDKGRLRVERAVLEQPSSHLSESFRATLASILSAPHTGEDRQNIVFTSSRPMEGKTTVVCNLGLALAGIGSQVLLIDGDMRRPRLHKIFDQANAWGLSDLLREWNSIQELPLNVIAKNVAPNLYLLPGGTSTDEAPGILYTSRISRLLARCREEFDYALVDAPPCLEFADARNMARYADGLVLVVRAKHTDRRTAQAAVQGLEYHGIRVTGLILNGWDPASAMPAFIPSSAGSRQSIGCDWKPLL
jgi:receptor protein-tyrosine kinase